MSMREGANTNNHAGQVDPSFIEGLSTVEFMIKRFIDDHAIERIELISKPPVDVVTQLNQDTSLTSKFDALAWLARSIELVSPYLVTDMVKNFKKSVSQPEQRIRREQYIKGIHGSHAVTTVI